MAAQFETTRWSLIQAAADTGHPECREALERLCRTYWPAVYAFLRSRGHEADDARELTQGFFTQLLERRSLRSADRERGRFRSFLLTGVKNFTVSEWHRAHRDKRGGNKILLRLDLSEAESMLVAESIDQLTPERIFDKRWVISLLRCVMQRLEEEMHASGKQELFCRIKPVLTGEGPTISYKDLAERLGMSESAVKVTVHRQRRRFGELLRAEIADTLSDPSLLEDELRHLRNLLAS